MTTDMEALIEGVKLDARNLMRSDPRVWHEALESALDKLLPAFWEASRAPQPTEAEWSCEQGCKAPSAVCLVDHRPAPQPAEDDADLPDPLQRIYWYSCDCDVRTKYCEEHHRRSITVGELLARRAPAEPATQDESRPQMSEHTTPTGDEREAWVDDDLCGVIDRAMQRSWTDAAEYEYAPSEITAAVRTWMDEQCFRRGAPAEPAVTEEENR